MKVAYWPGCVSRGFTPELHGSMAKVAPLLDIELVELDRASLLRRRRHRRAQPGARRHAQRAHVRARPAGRGRGADDEHLLHLPGRAVRVPGAPGRQHGVPRPRQRDAVGRGPRRYEKGIANKHFLWLMVEEIGLDKIASMVKRPLTGLRVGPFYGCYIVRPTDRLGIDREHPRDTLPASAHRDARRHRRRLRRPVQVLRLPDHHDEPAGVAQAGRPASRRRARRGGRLPRHAVPAVPPQPRPPAAAGREGRRPRRSACRCCTSRRWSGSPSGWTRRSSGSTSTSSSRRP